MFRPTRRSFIKTALGAAAFSASRLSIAQAPQVRTIAGTGTAGYEAEGARGLLATETPVNNPYGGKSVV